MEKNRSHHPLVVDVRIHYQGEVHSLALRQILAWLIPVILGAIRLAGLIHSSSS